MNGADTIVPLGLLFTSLSDAFDRGIWTGGERIERGRVNGIKPPGRTHRPLETVQETNPGGKGRNGRRLDYERAKESSIFYSFERKKRRRQNHYR